MGGGPACSPGVRRGSPGRSVQPRPGRQPRHLPGLAHSPESAADPARPDPERVAGPSASWSGSASTGRKPPPTVGRTSGPRAGGCAATGSPTSPTWQPSAATARSWSSTCAAILNGTPRTSKEPCTSRCTTCPPGSKSCPAARSGSTARRATAIRRRLPPRRRGPGGRGGRRRLRPRGQDRPARHPGARARGRHAHATRLTRHCRCASWRLIPVG